MTGIEAIAKERIRQQENEGWTAEHDEQHDNGALAMAACCYAAPERLYEREQTNSMFMFRDPWPFGSNWDKRRDKDWQKPIPEPRKMSRKKRVDLLVKAGALIAAEIDRLQRMTK